ncbi:hypothetical protein PT974_09584 [Cladobotryum mycophilum]|uniref:Secreted protein n=1 Tax=Cladobotryum mycophilum TaxID=491253 RepID=A0ABR0SGK4_9HYPO
MYFLKATIIFTVHSSSVVAWVVCDHPFRSPEESEQCFSPYKGGAMKVTVSSSCLLYAAVILFDVEESRFN